MKHKLLLLFFAICIVMDCSVVNAQGQWQQVGYMIAGTDTAKFNYCCKSFGSDVFFGTDKGLFKSSDLGSNWLCLTNQSAALKNRDIRAVYYKNAQFFVGTDSGLFKSMDNGITWQKVSTIADSVSINDIQEVGSNLVFTYSIQFSGGGVYYSSDNGSTWIKALGLRDLPTGALLIDGANLWLGGAKGISRSSNNGQTWDTSATGFPKACSFRDIIRIDNKLFSGDLYGGGLFVSSDNGSSWTKSDTAFFHGFCQIFSIIESHGKIILNQDGACASNGSKNIIMSSDTGKTWSAFNNGLPPQTYFPLVGKSSDGLNFFVKKAFGFEVYRYGGVAGGINEKINYSKDISIYPNPFKDQLYISFTKQNLKSDIKLIVRDLLGRTILSNENLGDENAISTAHFPSGIYLIQLYSKGQVVFSQKITK